MSDDLTVDNYVQKIKQMTPADRRNVTLKKLIELILATPNVDERQKNVENQIAQLQTSVNLISRISAENKEEIAALKAENAELSNEIVTLKENRDADENVKEEIKDLKDHINEIEQYLRINNLEFVGLPAPNKGEEDEMVIVNACNSLVGIDTIVRPQDIDISHPLKSQRRDNKPVSVARFISRKVKYAILTAKRSEENRQFKFRGQDVYINEHLSKINRGLFATAAEKKRTHGYKYLWTKNGVVNMRKQDNSEIVVISKESDFEKLV